MARIVVVGAGIAGLGVALFAGRAGHEVVLVERDDTPLPDNPSDAFDWIRTGAPQVRHSHAFLARLRNLLRDQYPDVLERLQEAGATPMDFIEMLPEGMDRSPMPGDEDLVALACRRTTFEWTLRHIVLDEGSATLVHGQGVEGLVVSTERERPRVTGVRLDNGEVLHADIVIAAGGRRGDLTAMLGVDGVEFPEEREDTGIVYFSRFFKLLDGAVLPPQMGPIGGDLGYLKFGIFQGDNRTFSVTLAARTGDSELRKTLIDPDRFLRIAELIPSVATQVDSSLSVPITGVNVMAGLVNQRRRFLDSDGRPLVLGFHAIGDAHTCTNPIYGRGCSLAMVQASLFTEALEKFGLDHEERAIAYEASSAEQVDPWYRAAVAQDRMNAQLAAGETGQAPESGIGATATARSREVSEGEATEATADSEAPGSDQARFMRELLTDGLFPAIRVDPVVLRAFLRMFNLLEAPDSLLTNSDVIGRVMTVFQQRDQREPEAPLGPTRSEILAAT
ncbi:MAG TPA: FAD-dependent oxidoreductase [Microthrixaceae bacterium]|nr:FAD-dependent oxidoreductase [Microthrixaceae bacterium]